MSGRKSKPQETASTIDFEVKALNDELKAFKKYKPVFIPCPYTRDKLDTFKKMIERENMEYDETIHKDYNVFLRLDGYDLMRGDY